MSTGELIDLTPKISRRRMPAVLSSHDDDERLYDCAVKVTRTNVIAVVGAQGGSGKTRITFALGSALAQFAGLNVVAVDLDDDYGALLDLVPENTRASRPVHEVMEREGPVPYPELRACLSVTRSRMLVMRGPGEANLDDMLARLGNADVVILDCAAGLHRERAEWAILRGDQVIVVARPEASGSQTAASATEHALLGMEAQGTLVLNRRRSRAGSVEAERAFQTVGGLLSTVHVPESRTLAQAMEAKNYRIEALDGQTRRAIKELAVTVGERLR